MNYPLMFNRDEIFYRLGIEQSEELLQIIKSAENPNFQDDKGLSYLHMACQSHYYEAIKLLLELGADPNIRDYRDSSPVFSALGRRNENNNAILELMLQYGLDLDKTEGNKTVKEKIEYLRNEELKQIVENFIKNREEKKS